MSEESRIDRRSLLLGALVAAVPLGLAPFRPWRALIEVLPGEPLASRLAGMLSDPESARVVGREYLRVMRSEATTAHGLVDAIVAGIPGGRGVIRAASGADLRAAILARVRQDFDDDDIVTLDGWIVSKTEGQLCALHLT